MSATAETTIDSQASHDRESGGPSSAAKSAFVRLVPTLLQVSTDACAQSHEKDADAHPETRDLSKAEPGSVEALASGTSAQNERAYCLHIPLR
jgi:hypothetical protein